MKNRVDEFIKNPKKGLFKLATPILIAMLVQALYNIVDTAFVGRLGAESIAALTFSFPLFFIIISLNIGINAGMTSRISRFMGEKKKEDAENTGMHGLLISIILGLVVLSLGIIYLKPLLNILGASANVLVLSIDYMKIILYGVLFVFLNFVFQGIFNGQGDMKTPMQVQVSTLILNIILDPIFIYVLGYGVKGAAIATVISMAVSTIMLIYFIKTRSYLKVNWKIFNFKSRLVKAILFVGAPASLMMLLLSIYFMVINKLMAFFGTNYVAAFGIVSRLDSVIIMPNVAIGMALMTIVGMFYGAKKYDLVKEISWFSLKITFLFNVVIGAIFFLFPRMFMMIFTNEEVLLGLGSAYIMISVFAYPLFAFSMLISRVMQGMGLGMPGLVINFIRIVFVAIPLSYIFVYILSYGYLSIAVAMIIGSLVATLIAFGYLRNNFNKLSGQARQRWIQK